MSSTVDELKPLPGPSPEAKESFRKGAVAPIIEVSQDLDEEAMQEAYDETFRKVSEGDVVKGTVLKVTAANVVVDVGFKSEGLISVNEFKNEEGSLEVKPGDKVDVLLERTENHRGCVVVSRQKAERMKVWDTIEQAYRDQTVIKGRVLERIKGGLAVDVGLRGFLPGSQIDLHPVQNPDIFRGEELRMRVIKVNKRRGNIVLSRKAVLEEENFKLKEETLKNIEEGTDLMGTVKNITDYGVFVDLGGIDGLLHITDMSWGRVNHPADLFEVGEEIKVKILRFDRLEEKVSLGYKQLSDDPWLTALERYPRNSRVNTKVVSLTDYGAFVALEEGVEGLIHISEMTWNRRVKHPSQLLTVGDDAEAVVLEIDAQARRISLGTKQMEPNPWDLISEKYAINSIVTGTVRNLTDFGAFVEVEDGIEGLVHISDLSWTKKIRHPSEILQKGDEVSVVVLNIDAGGQRLSLGIKQLGPDNWEEFFSKHQIGDKVQGRIVRLTNFGAFVEISDGVEGLCHVSELSESHVENPEDHFKVEEAIELKIIKMNLLERKIGLSVKALTEPVEEENESRASEIPTTSIGERAGEQLGRLKKKAESEKGDEDDEG